MGAGLVPKNFNHLYVAMGGFRFANCKRVVVVSEVSVMPKFLIEHAELGNGCTH